MEVWMAQGTSSGDGAVTATFASAPSTAVIAVSRYSGIDAANPVGNVIAGKRSEMWQPRLRQFPRLFSSSRIIRTRLIPARCMIFLK
jgi:hypothetical protein